MHANFPQLGLAALALALAQIMLAGAPAGLPETASASVSGSVTMVQAVPGRTVAIRIDGLPIRRAADVGDVVGPVQLAAGRHRITFVNAGRGRVSAWVRIAAGSSRDVVLHRPTARAGRPVVSSFRTPTGGVAPGRARLVVAPAARIVPADVRVDGRVVFTNIATGESARTQVQPGIHRVTVVPTGLEGPAVLGPVDVAVAPGTVTIVYAVAGPGAGAAIVHTLALRPGGGVAPGTLDTGTVGLARHLSVHQFGGADR
jgi:hypothetical protein